MNRTELLFPREPARFDRDEFHRLLQHAKAIEASDIHIKTMTRIMCRVHGHLVPVTNRRLEDAEVATILQVLYGAANAELEVRTGKPLDNAYRLTLDRDTYLRFRWNAHACEVRGAFGIKITLRELPAMPPRLPKDDLGDEVVEALFSENGLVLICGATGSGKSTLLAGIIRAKAEEPEADCNIVTLESPIEFTYDKVSTESCMITQTAVPQNLPSFSKGVENALREDPDIVLVGEARDAATIEAMNLASQTGHLVFGTVHSNTVGTTFLRLTQSLPAEKADSILGSLIDAIRVVICQRLYPSTDGRRVAVRETLVFDRAIRRELLRAATRNIAELPVVADDLVRRYGQTMLAHAEQLVVAGRLDPMYVEVLRTDEQVARQLRVKAPAQPVAVGVGQPTAVPAPSPDQLQELLRRLAAVEAALGLAQGVAQPAAGTPGDHSAALQEDASESAPAAAAPSGGHADTPRAEGVEATTTEGDVVATVAIDAVESNVAAVIVAEGSESETRPPHFWEAARDRVQAQLCPIPGEAVPAVTGEVVASATDAGAAGDSAPVGAADLPAHTPTGVEREASIEAMVVEIAEAERSAVPVFGQRLTPLVAGPVLAPADDEGGARTDEPPCTDGQPVEEAGIERSASPVLAVVDDFAFFKDIPSPALPVPSVLEDAACSTESASTASAVDAVGSAAEAASVAGSVAPVPVADEGQESVDEGEGGEVPSALAVAEPLDTAGDIAVAIRREPAIVMAFPVLDGEPSALTERRLLLGEICAALSTRLETEAPERIQVQMASDFLKSVSVAGLPQHMWQHVWVRLKQHLEATGETLALRLAGETVFNKQQRGDGAGDIADWELVRRARALAQEPFFMPRVSDATA